LAKQLAVDQVGVLWNSEQLPRATSKVPDPLQLNEVELVNESEFTTTEQLPPGTSTAGAAVPEQVGADEQRTVRV
jgi:hypothetical protein